MTTTCSTTCSAISTPRSSRSPSRRCARTRTTRGSPAAERDGDRGRLRPSDAIALAVRAGAKIYVADEVIEESGVEFEGEVTGDEIAAAAGVSPLAELDPDEFRAFLDTVSPDQFADEPEEET